MSSFVLSVTASALELGFGGCNTYFKNMSVPDFDDWGRAEGLEFLFDGAENVFFYR